MKFNKPIILASRSPARFKILREAGIPVERAFPDVDESRLRGETVRHYVMRIAEAKAKKIAKKERDAIIIAVDTVISYKSHIFGKPKNKKEARKFLKTLSGKMHRVFSGTVVINSKSGKTLKKIIVTKVKFAKLSNEIIDWYIKTGEPMHAAGAYSIQSKGRALIESLDGCFTNVIGVSISQIFQMIKSVKSSQGN